MFSLTLSGRDYYAIGQQLLAGTGLLRKHLVKNFHKCESPLRYAATTYFNNPDIFPWQLLPV